MDGEGDRAATAAQGSRRYDERVEVDYADTLAFFQERAQRVTGGAPTLTAVLYQDGDPDLAARRDEAERERVLPWLGLDGTQSVLDVGCGVGRWGGHLAGRVARYQGVDFSAGLVDLAREALAGRYRDGAWAVDVASATEVSPAAVTLAGPFDLAIVAGVLIYLNDADVDVALGAVGAMLADAARVYLREPVAVDRRLTLDRLWSDELAQRYTATYRTAAWYQERFEATLGALGFAVTRSEQLDPALQNRAETSQHFWLLERP